MVASSTSPTGPFTLVRQRASVEHKGGGDMTLMVLEAAESGSGRREAYISYDAWENEHTQVIERLNDQFTDSLGAAASSGPVSPPNNEAPILFHRRGWFYLLFGNTCCFCREGADSQVSSPSQFHSTSSVYFFIPVST